MRILCIVNSKYIDELGEAEKAHKTLVKLYSCTFTPTNYISAFFRAKPPKIFGLIFIFLVTIFYCYYLQVTIFIDAA